MWKITGSSQGDFLSEGCESGKTDHDVQWEHKCTKTPGQNCLQIGIHLLCRKDGIWLVDIKTETRDDCKLRFQETELQCWIFLQFVFDCSLFPWVKNQKSLNLDWLVSNDISGLASCSWGRMNLKILKKKKVKVHSEVLTILTHWLALNIFLN